MQKKHKKYLVNILLLLFSILLILCALELSMRVIGRIKNIDFRLYLKDIKNSERLPKELYAQDDALQWILAPNTQVLATTSDFSVIYKINSKGLRDKEYDFKKPENKIRILALEDSFTFGEGVDYGDRFTDIIERCLPDTEVINFGVPGYGLDQILLDFAKEGLRYSPDYIMIFMHSAIIGRFNTSIIKDGSVILEKNHPKKVFNGSTTAYFAGSDDFFVTGKNIILKNSYFLSYIKYRITLFALKNKLQQYDKNLWDKIFASANSNKIPAEKKEDQDSLIKSDMVRDRTILLIKKLNEICKERGIKIIIVNISPSGDMDYLKNIDKDILYYSIVDDLMNYGSKRHLYFVYDGHYNKETHAFIANKVIAILKEVIKTRSRK